MKTTFNPGLLEWRKETGHRAERAGRVQCTILSFPDYKTPRTDVHTPVSTKPLFDNQYAWHVRLCDRIKRLID